MDKAAIGISVHSGWGALVVLTSDRGKLEVLHRARVEIIGNEIPGCKQPYHHAENLPLAQAKQHLANCAAASSKLTVEALRTVVHELQADGKRPAGAVILLASGRPLPDLASILNAHPLIHTAEGEFFRRIFWEACCHLEIPPAGFQVRDLGETATNILGKTARAKLERNIQTLGKAIGSPWTSDYKNAALAASLVLLEGRKKVRSRSLEPAKLAIT